jgi:hypothetical protein
MEPQRERVENEDDDSPRPRRVDAFGVQAHETVPVDSKRADQTPVE